MLARALSQRVEPVSNPAPWTTALWVVLALAAGGGLIWAFTRRSSAPESTPEADGFKLTAPEPLPAPDPDPAVAQIPNPRPFFAAAKCALPTDVREEQAQFYAEKAVKALRKASNATLQSKRDKFPCNDPERLSWVIDEAFRLWIQGDPTADARCTTCVWWEPGSEVDAIWNHLFEADAPISLTAERYQDLQKGWIRRPWTLVELTTHLNACERYLEALLRHYATSECPGVSTTSKPLGPG